MICIRNPVDEDDFRWLLTLQADPGFYRWTKTPRPQTAEIAEELAAKRNLCKTGLGRFIFADIRGLKVGYVAAFKSGSTVHIEYAVSAAYRRCGIGKAILLHMVQTSGTFGVHTYTAFCDPENIASAKLLRLTGFARERSYRSTNQIYDVYELTYRAPRRYDLFADGARSLREKRTEDMLHLTRWCTVPCGQAAFARWIP